MMPDRRAPECAGRCQYAEDVQVSQSAVCNDTCVYLTWTESTEQASSGSPGTPSRDSGPQRAI